MSLVVDEEANVIKKLVKSNETKVLTITTQGSVVCYSPLVA